jgi:hypothetical protein
MQLPANRSSRYGSKSILRFLEMKRHEVSGFGGAPGLYCIHDCSVRVDHPTKLRLGSSALQSSANRDSQALSQRAREKGEKRIAGCLSDRLMKANVMWDETIRAPQCAAHTGYGQSKCLDVSAVPVGRGQLCGANLNRSAQIQHLFRGDLPGGQRVPY